MVDWSFDPRQEDAAERVRTEIRHALEEHRRADAIMRLDMIYAELVSNAIRHAPGTIEIAVECLDSGGDVTLHVRDRGPGYRLNAHLPSDIFSEVGRGLFIIATFADGFIVEARNGGGSHARIVLKPRGERV
jgi:anti-sigma regulatory factor (Ser/Thr protein kinase)